MLVYIFFIRHYCSLDIQFIWNIMKDKFKSKNILKLSTSVGQTKEATKNLKLGINRLKIGAKKENWTILNAKRNILPLCLIYIYTQISISIADQEILLLFKLTSAKYGKNFRMLWETYIRLFLWEYCFHFHQCRILERIHDLQASKILDDKLKRYLLVPHFSIIIAHSNHKWAKSVSSGSKMACFLKNAEKNFLLFCKWFHHFLNCSKNYTKTCCTPKILLSPTWFRLQKDNNNLKIYWYLYLSLFYIYWSIFT